MRERNEALDCRVYRALQNGLQSRPVPATEIAHVYEKQRTQARGVPWGAPVIRSLPDLDDYEVAELVRTKTEACVTAIVFGDVHRSAARLRER